LLRKRSVIDTVVVFYLRWYCDPHPACLLSDLLLKGVIGADDTDNNGYFLQ